MLLDMPQAQDIKDATLFWLGEVHFKGNDYKLAADYYHKLISEFPSSDYFVFAYYSLGWSLFEQGSFQEAIKYHKEIIKDFPDHELADEATFKIAESLYNLKQCRESEGYFHTYIEKFPKQELTDQAYFYLGELNYYQEEFDIAIKNYSKVIDISNDKRMVALAKTGIGWSYLKLKRYNEAKSIFKEAIELTKDKNYGLDLILLGEATLLNELGSYKEALEVYERVIITLPESEILLDAYLGKADSLYSLGKGTEAVAVYKTILGKSKDHIRLKKDDLIDKAHFGLAWSYLKAGRLNDAIKEFQIIVENTDDKIARIRALCQIGDIYQDIGNLQESLDSYDKILKDYPDSFYSDYVQYQEGIILLKLERIDAATIAFQSLRTNFPDSKYIIDSLYYLGLAYFKKGDFVSAKVHLEDLIRDRSKGSSYRQEAIFLLGATLYNLGKYREAVNTYNIVKKVENKELVHKAEYEIANCFYQMGKTADALKKFKIIVYKFPESDVALDALDWLGNYYLKINNFETARKYFQKIIDGFSTNATVSRAHYEIGRSYHKEKLFDEALEHLKIVRESSSGKLAGLASLEIADIFSQTEDKDSVVGEYKKILVEYPSLAKQTHVKLGEFYSSLGIYEEAIDEFRRALNVSSDDESEVGDFQIQFNIAELFEEKGDLDKAVEAYFKVTYLYPKDKLSIKSYLRIARIFENRKSWDKAKKIYKRIVEEEAEESKFAQEKLDWINENIRY